jgi:hypothetical protein
MHGFRSEKKLAPELRAAPERTAASRCIRYDIRSLHRWPDPAKISPDETCA